MMNIIKSNSGVRNRDIYYKKFDNGLRCILMPIKNYSKKHCICSFNYGANDITYYKNNKTVSTSKGIAHFLEHKMFEQKGHDAFDEFSKIGMDANAYTSHKSTVYYFEGTGDFYKGLKILLTFLTQPGFSIEGVEKEKGIIEQELDMYKDDADWMVYFNLLSCMYKDHPITYDIVGTKKSLKSITVKELTQCYDSFYTGGNCIIIALGDIDSEEFFAEVNILNTFISGKGIGITKQKNKQQTGIVHNFSNYNLPIAKPMFNIGIKDDHELENLEDKLKKTVIMDIALDILFGSGSNCFNNLYEEQLIDSLLYPGYTHGLDYGFSIMGGKSHNPDMVLKEVKKTLEGYNNLITIESLERAIIRHKSGIIKSLDNLSDAAEFLVECYIHDMDPHQYMCLLDNIKIEDIIEYTQCSIDKNNLCLSVISGV